MHHNGFVYDLWRLGGARRRGHQPERSEGRVEASACVSEQGETARFIFQSEVNEFCRKLNSLLDWREP